MDALLIAETAVALALAGWIWTLLKVLVGIGLVIFVHELGHFVVAKACGVKCEKFYIGFDAFEIPLGRFRIPASLWKKQIGETEYGVGILPLGGYVKMLGQDDDPRKAEQESKRIRLRPDSGTEGAGAGELDPRSFPARPVPQRMAIISAGVLMNLVSAALLAAIAFGLGVQYTPCVVGALTPGDPAWRAGLQPGDQIIRVGQRGEPSEHLRFGADLSVQVILNGPKRPLELLLRPRGGGPPRRVTLTPTPRLAEQGQRAAIGVRPAESNELAAGQPVVAHLAAARAAPALRGGDRIVAVDGQPVADGIELNARLAQRPGDPLTLSVQRPDAERSTPQTLQVRLPAQPLRHLGLTLQMGPIVAVRRHSPAHAAGLQPGDVIRALQGQPVDDPVALPERTAALAGQTVTLDIVRDGQRRQIDVTPEPPQFYVSLYGPEALLSDEALGVAYQVAPRIVRVDPEGPAAAAGLKPNDRIVAAQLVVPDGQPLDPAARQILKPALGRVIQLDQGQRGTWAEVHGMIQWSPPGVRVRLWVRRDGQLLDPVELAPVASKQWHWAERGLLLTPMMRVRRAASVTEALALGARETKERFVEVLRVLGQLLTLRMSPKGLTGPVGLVNISLQVAEAGIVQLLLFLTFLSVNLAILNFLPIPALDGGHMVFLIAEAVRGEPVDEKLQIRLTIIGISLLLTLMLFVTVLDIRRLLP